MTSADQPCPPLCISPPTPPPIVPPIDPSPLVPAWIWLLLGALISLLCIGALLWVLGRARDFLESLVTSLLRRKVERHNHRRSRE